MHHLTYDLGRPQGKRTYDPGRDARNCIVRCNCGWAHSGTFFTVEERGMVHMGAFRKEFRDWNDPERRATMPNAYGRSVEQAA